MTFWNFFYAHPVWAYFVLTACTLSIAAVFTYCWPNTRLGRVEIWNLNHIDLQEVDMALRIIRYNKHTGDLCEVARKDTLGEALDFIENMEVLQPKHIFWHERIFNCQNCGATVPKFPHSVVPQGWSLIETDHDCSCFEELTPA